MEEVKYNKWFGNNSVNGIFKDMENVNQIPNLTFLSSNYEYVLYHIYLMEVTNVDQLVIVTDLSVREIRNSIKKLNSKNFIESIPIIFYGNIVNFLYLTSAGLDRVVTLFEINNPQNIRKVSNKDLKHFVEINVLHLNLYRHVNKIIMSKEKKVRVNRDEILRADAVFDIEYSNGNKEHLVLEHDRGSERISKISGKLFQYAIAICVNSISNVSFSISKEPLMSKSHSDAIWSIPELDELKVDSKIVAEVIKIKNKFGINTFVDLYELYTRIKGVLQDEHINDYRNYSEEELKDYHFKISRFFEIIKNNQLAGVFTNDRDVKISSFSQMLNDALDKRKRTIIINAINNHLLKNELERCDLIKSLINNQDDYLDISNKQIRKFDISDYKNVFEEGMSSSIRSFKSLLLTHECSILPMQQMVKFYNWKVQMNKHLNHSLVNYFGLKDKNYEIICNPIKLYSGENVIEKKENTFIILNGSRRYGFMIMDTVNVFSDELKMRVIEANIDNLTCDLDAVYCVDVAGCEWQPAMKEKLKEIHSSWGSNIITIKSSY